MLVLYWLVLNIMWVSLVWFVLISLVRLRILLVWMFSERLCRLVVWGLCGEWVWLMFLICKMILLVVVDCVWWVNLILWLIIRWMRLVML